MITKPRRAGEVTLSKREDGRYEVAVDGWVKWCGHDEAVAHDMAWSLAPDPAYCCPTSQHLDRAADAVYGRA